MRTLRHQLIAAFYRLQLKWILYHADRLRKPDSYEWIFYLRKKINSMILPAPKAIVHTITDEKVKGLVISAKETPANKAILYFHGGGYIFGSPKLYIQHAYHLSVACDARVYVIDYRMAPEYSYIEALEDAQQAYQFLLKSGIEPKNISIGGDSAGGGLTIAVLFLLREKKFALPASFFCISPWVDLLLTTQSFKLNIDKDYMLPFSTEWTKQGVALYSRNQDPADPFISPLYGKFEGLPPLIIQSGGDERLIDENKLLFEKAKAAGMSVDYEVWPDMPHDFQLLPLPESKAAINKIGKFVQSHMG